jgi:hypothetical protein
VATLWWSIAGYWSALGITFAVVELAVLLVDRAAEAEFRDLGRKAMKLAYVRVTPRLGGGLAAGRTVLMARVFPVMAVVGLATAFVSTVALTVFPKYWSVAEDADLYHALNAPFYVGLGAAYVVVFVLLGSFLRARRLARPLIDAGAAGPETS